MNTQFAFLSGSTEINGARVDRVLIASTQHMPDLDEDISVWHSGQLADFGMAWIWAYDEEVTMNGQFIPQWLLNLCTAARQNHGCNWVLLDPDGDIIPGLPIYEHQ